ncbi:hypothetical protein [Haliangium sp.]|uniref:hypothetical protein n=1 Tax=Haliangium sp. TaxID=2663208 RepID=UPI003D14EA58
MSHEALDPNKKHRHDIGAVDHGAISDAATTRTIQVMLGLLVAASAILTVWAVIVAVFDLYGR